MGGGLDGVVKGRHCGVAYQIFYLRVGPDQVRSGCFRLHLISCKLCIQVASSSVLIS